MNEPGAMTVGEAIRAAAERLAAVSDTARLDAELLMAHALGLTTLGLCCCPSDARSGACRFSPRWSKRCAGH